jgi:tRNA splicing endonuclease
MELIFCFMKVYRYNFLDDPNFVHSEYLLYITENDREMDVDDLIRIERISVTTKKKFMIATVKDDSIIYFNYEWIKL